MPHSFKPMASVDRSTINHSIVLTDAEQAYILDSIAEGKKTITEICFDLKINTRALYDYAFKDPLFDKEMSKARVYQSHVRVDELLKVHNGCDSMAQVARAKVISDNIKWSAGKFAPQRFGENLNVNVSHHLDLSSILLAAENRVIPILKAKNALNAQNALNAPETAREDAPGSTITVEYAPSPQPIAPATPSINELNVTHAIIPDTQQPTSVPVGAIGAIEIPKEWI